MRKLSGDITINAPAEQVWTALADLERVQDYSPGVAAAQYTTEAREGVGAGRHCDLQGPPGWVEERIVEWQEGESMTIEIFASSPPIKHAFGHFTLASQGDETRVTFGLEYKLMFGPIGSIMDAIIVRRLFDKSIKTTLEGLKYNVETGEAVGKKVPAAASGATAA